MHKSIVSISLEIKAIKFYNILLYFSFQLNNNKNHAVLYVLLSIMYKLSNEKVLIYLSKNKIILIFKINIQDIMQ